MDQVGRFDDLDVPLYRIGGVGNVEPPDPQDKGVGEVERVDKTAVRTAFEGEAGAGGRGDVGGRLGLVVSRDLLQCPVDPLETGLERPDRRSCVSATSLVVARAVWSEANCPRRVPAVSCKELRMSLSRLVTFVVKSTSDCFSQTALRAAASTCRSCRARWWAWISVAVAAITTDATRTAKPARDSRPCRLSIGGHRALAVRRNRNQSIVCGVLVTDGKSIQGLLNASEAGMQRGNGRLL